MNTKILTEDERGRAKRFIHQGGKKEQEVRKLAYFTRHYLVAIQADVELLEKFMRRYDESTSRNALSG